MSQQMARTFAKVLEYYTGYTLMPWCVLGDGVQLVFHQSSNYVNELHLPSLLGICVVQCCLIIESMR